MLTALTLLNIGPIHGHDTHYNFAPLARTSLCQGFTIWRCHFNALETALPQENVLLCPDGNSNTCLNIIGSTSIRHLVGRVRRWPVRPGVTLACTVRM